MIKYKRGSCCGCYGESTLLFVGGGKDALLHRASKCGRRSGNDQCRGHNLPVDTVWRTLNGNKCAAHSSNDRYTTNEKGLFHPITLTEKPCELL